MILDSRNLLWSEKLQSLQFFNEQIFDFNNHYEKDRIGILGGAVLRFLKGVSNPALRKLKKQYGGIFEYFT